VLELARRKRSAPLELAEDVPPEARLLLQELQSPLLALVVAPALPHPGLNQREVLLGPDERVPLEEPSLFQQAVELGTVVRTEAAPEDEILRRCDRRDRIHLQESQSADRVRDVRR
jgi:hypothetical protein